MTTPAIAELETIIRRHTEEVRVHLLGVVVAALSGEATAAPTYAKEPKSVTPRAAKKGAKRSPEALEQLTKKLLGYITKNPGERIEQIGVGLEIATKELLLPMRKLIAQGSVRAKGVKRATSYTAKA